MDPRSRAELGRTGLQVTRLGLGTAPLGGLYEPVAEQDAVRTVERAYELGLRFFDTAPLYGTGLAERRLGQALRQYPRDSFVLATKVGRLLRAGAPPEPGQVYQGTPEDVQPVFDFSAVRAWTASASIASMCSTSTTPTSITSRRSHRATRSSPGSAARARFGPSARA
jgi:aryl-alcohol dehydrogenase-like predicted oxidoreductase